jgi:tetratricopeptide (TPR) repeat protein
MPRSLRWPLAILFLLALTAQSLRASRLLGASRRLHAVEITSARAAALGESGAPLLAANLGLCQVAELLDPAAVAAPMFRGSIHLLRQRPREAIAAYEEALRKEPRSEIYLNLGRAYLAAGNPEKARELLALVSKLDPRLVPKPAAPRTNGLR